MIKTERLLLRPARLGDLDALHDIMSDPKAMRYWDRPAHDNRATTQRFLQALIACPTEFVIERDGACIGKAGMWRPNDLGYLLSPDHWGLGLASEAVEALVGYLFSNDKHLHHLTAETDRRNFASRRVLEKSGFTLEKIVQLDFLYAGREWCDTAYFRLNRDPTLKASSGKPPPALPR